MIKCKVCGETIVKYKLDLGDTIYLGDINKESIYVCDDCARRIARSLIER